MDARDPPRGNALGPVAKIVASYVGNHALPPDQLVALIVLVRQVLEQLGKAAEPAPARQPAVPVKRSVQPDHVICLECGFRGRTLRRHLSTRHGLQPAEYLRRWSLPSDHPLTAPAYSAQRSAMAKRLGLGRQPGATRGRPRRSRG
jgi:predicted transcriptional regulator